MPTPYHCLNGQRLYFVKACGEGDIERLQTRLGRGEDVESNDLQGNTGMHVAAATSHIGVMEFLLDNKADKEARNKNVSKRPMDALSLETEGEMLGFPYNLWKRLYPRPAGIRKDDSFVPAAP